MDRRYLTMIAETYKGGPVGVETLAAGLSEPRDTVEEVIEPYLIQLGLIARTARGRCLNDGGWEHLEMTPPAECPGDSGRRASAVRGGRAESAEMLTYANHSAPFRFQIGTARVATLNFAAKTAPRQAQYRG